MKIKEECILQNIADKWVVINTNAKSVNFNKIISLNESGKFLWEQLEKGRNLEELINEVAEYFGIDEELAKKDIEKFVNDLHNLGCIDDEE